MPTVGQVVTKIAELRSRVAIGEALVLYLRAHYVSSDSGDAEMKITRDDHAFVPEGHVGDYIQQIVDDVDEARAELSQWENLSLPAPADAQPNVTTRKGKKAAREAES
jgi:hypothetical protein